MLPSGVHGNDRSQPTEKQLPVCSMYDVYRHTPSGSSYFNGIVIYLRRSRVHILGTSSFQKNGVIYRCCPLSWWGSGTSIGQAYAPGHLILTLGPRSSSFLNSRLLVGVFVERSFLVNEPAVTRPQDQVQKAKNLHKDIKMI